LIWEDTWGDSGGPIKQKTWWRPEKRGDLQTGKGKFSTGEQTANRQTSGVPNEKK